MSKTKDKARSRRQRDAQNSEKLVDVDVEAKWRDSIEQIVIAIILALLFRAFEAEAFVIPTGSMAPTLMGRHKDIKCEKCGHPVRAGANVTSEMNSGPAVGALCPLCRYENDVSPQSHKSYSGDRILVNKFAYQFGDPQRWDVIVFKYPGNPKQNYIKRLVGLPNETLRVRHGDIYIKGEGESEFTIARKPPRKIDRLLQVVYDTKYVAPELVAANWPSRWFGRGWEVALDQQSANLAASDSLSWLRYRHIPPTHEEWRSIESKDFATSPDRFQGELITDFCSYNAFRNMRSPLVLGKTRGWHWVGDLAGEYDVRVEGDQGTLALDVVEAGRHYSCRFNVADGMATLTIDNGDASFSDGAKELTAETKVRGSGRYRLRLANIDDQVLLWVNGKPVQFMSGETPHAATYNSPEDMRPRSSVQDPGDLHPLGIAAQGVAVTVERLITYRDLYYIATEDPRNIDHIYFEAWDYELPHNMTTYSFEKELLADFDDPSRWNTSRVFQQRRTVEFSLEDDQFFPMGDNSRASKDARVWHGDGIEGPQVSNFTDTGYIEVDHCVERKRLIGKAFFVYWPHGWYWVVPNVGRMERIR